MLSPGTELQTLDREIEVELRDSPLQHYGGLRGQSRPRLRLVSIRSITHPISLEKADRKGRCLLERSILHVPRINEVVS